MFLGLDLGTSALKALLVDGEQRVVGAATAPVSVQRPAPGHSEQDPEAWWQALLAVMREREQRLWAGYTIHGLRRIGDAFRMHHKRVLLINSDNEMPLLQFLI